MKLVPLLVALFTVGVSCDYASRTEIRNREIQAWKEELSPDQVTIDAKNPLTYYDERNIGGCWTACSTVWSLTGRTLIPERGYDTSLEINVHEVLSKANKLPDPVDMGLSETDVVYESVTDGWTAGASATKGPITISAAYSWSSTHGMQTSRTSFVSYRCPPFSRCFSEIFTASLKVKGKCKTNYQTRCKSTFFGIKSTRDTCSGFQWWCPDDLAYRNSVCVGDWGVQDCELSIPVMDAGKPKTHQFDYYEYAVPVGVGLVGGWCQLDNGLYYNYTSNMYWDAESPVDGAYRPELPKPVDLSKCGIDFKADDEAQGAQSATTIVLSPTSTTAPEQPTSTPGGDEEPREQVPQSSMGASTRVPAPTVLNGTFVKLAVPKARR